MSDVNTANSFSSFRSVAARSILAALLGLLGVSGATGGQVCKPALAIKDVQFSAMKPPTMERKWTAMVSVDASRCAANSAGYFEIGFLLLKENAPEIEVREEFAWLEFSSTPSVKVGVDFWADEAVEHYWFENVTPCPCRD